jgi:hypothetical protein
LGTASQSHVQIVSAAGKNNPPHTLPCDFYGLGFSKSTG